MNHQPIFLEPVFKERVWGGEKLQKVFRYPITSQNTGECWGISAHPNGQCFVRDGELKGSTLGQLWEEKRFLFGDYQSDKFPLLTKIIDANDDLSVQVHPDDIYANEYENGELGKTECWYVIDCEEGAEIVLGHTAGSTSELIERVSQNQWNKLLKTVKVKPGDFFFVPSGTIHAIGKGILILETQQNSDTTYRVYDYDRKDENGQTRELHIEKAIEVISVPGEVTISDLEIVNESMIKLIESDYFSVYKILFKDSLKMNQNKAFCLVSVIEGKGELNGKSRCYSFEKGEHFILPYQFGEYELKGNAELIISYPE
jgi:mannose-6-phosphate isomerase